MENLNSALLLLAIGMGTVFIILVFIILFSQLLIKVINRYFPEEVSKQATKSIEKIDSVPPKVIAAISTAINICSNGKMKVSKIEKR